METMTPLSCNMAASSGRRMWPPQVTPLQEKHWFWAVASPQDSELVLSPCLVFRGNPGAVGKAEKGPLALTSHFPQLPGGLPPP